ncbi:hypothetical protein, partial [Vibrio parahaemolyticus]|uniref:hypothetical protein n=1 Tax=Vibrio parahaemolyticus TaxID=670 RepID=UPI0027D45670
APFALRDNSSFFAVTSTFSSCSFASLVMSTSIYEFTIFSPNALLRGEQRNTKAAAYRLNH